MYFILLKQRASFTSILKNSYLMLSVTGQHEQILSLNTLSSSSSRDTPSSLPFNDESLIEQGDSSEHIAFPVKKHE